MKDIMALDCTLRDGGYCNKWDFGEKNIKKIIDGLIAGKVEIIECGFLTNRVSFISDVTKYTSVDQLQDIIPDDVGETKFVLMMNYGEYDASLLPKKQQSKIDGIRVAFHKKDRNAALKLCAQIKEKGYMIFIQPMVTMLYSEQEFKKLIDCANELNPFAFYIVDSFGTMNKKSLLFYLKLLESNLDHGICIGLHSHNNLQSAFSNAQILLEKELDYSLIVDSSVYGMGRGAGNLNSELFLNNLNAEYGKHYDVKPLLKIMDEVINRFYEEKPWGYSLPNYLSAVHMIHPNYAGFLSSKNTLTVADIDNIFSLIDLERGAEYDEDYINELYIQYMSTGVVRDNRLNEIREKTRGKKILLIGPGRSVIAEQKKIKDFVRKENPIVISLNHEESVIPSDYIFVSNRRRFSQIDKRLYCKIISTSNIKSVETYVSMDYFKLINSIDCVCDNAVLMAVKFAIDDLGAKEIFLAGIDGFSHDVYANFSSKEMALFTPEELVDRTNEGLEIVIKEYQKLADISFITSTKLKL